MSNPFKKSTAQSASAGAAAEPPPPPAAAPKRPDNSRPAPPNARPVQYVRVGADYCRGLRVTYRAILRALGTTKFVTAMSVCLPMIFLGIMMGVTSADTIRWGMNGQEYAAYFAFMQGVLRGPLAVTASFTYFFGLIALLAIWQGMQNLLGVCAWVFRVIGHFILVSVIILVVAGYGMAERSAINVLLSWVFPPIFIWLLAAGVMDAHRQIVTEQIDRARAGMSAAAETDVIAEDGHEAAVSVELPTPQNGGRPVPAGKH